MGYLLENCTLQVFNQELLNSSEKFDCGNEDLNDFFLKVAIKYSTELLGKSYCFTLDSNPKIIVCAFTISNDSIKTFTLPNSRKKKVNSEIPRQKQMKSYPAVLIGRLGVDVYFRKKVKEEKTIGDQLVDFIKAWFVDNNNKTGCRFIVVDSYNDEKPLNYYKRNGFNFVFSSEEQEKEHLKLSSDSLLKTRLLYFDLILLSE